MTDNDMSNWERDMINASDEVAQSGRVGDSEPNAPASVEAAYVPQVGDVVKHRYSSVTGTVVDARHDKFIYLVDFGNEKPNQVLPSELILQQPHAESATTADAQAAGGATNAHHWTHEWNMRHVNAALNTDPMDLTVHQEIIISLVVDFETQAIAMEKLTSALQAATADRDIAQEALAALVYIQGVSFATYDPETRVQRMRDRAETGLIKSNYYVRKAREEDAANS